MHGLVPGKELMTNHHKEEERDLFPKVRRLMSDVALDKLGAKMLTLFDANVRRGHEAVLATFDDELRKPVRAKKKGKRTPEAGTSGRPPRRTLDKGRA